MEEVDTRVIAFAPPITTLRPRGGPIWESLEGVWLVEIVSDGFGWSY